MIISPGSGLLWKQGGTRFMDFIGDCFFCTWSGRWSLGLSHKNSVARK